MEKLNRHDVSENVKQNIVKYLRENLPAYELISVMRASNHPEDSYLYQAIAKHKNGEYACWTCWNETTKTLNYGHYMLESIDSAAEICNEMYHRI